MAAGVNFYPSAEVSWSLSLAAPDLTAGSQDQVSGAIATLAAPGYAPGAVTATIKWGDGTSGPATVTGTAATGTTVNSLYTVAGTHTYAKAGSYQATVTVSASGASSVTAHFTVTARSRRAWTRSGSGRESGQAADSARRQPRAQSANPPPSS